MKKSMTLLWLISLILLSCSKDDNNPLDPVGTDPNWEYGKTKSYNLAELEGIYLVDDITGYTFVFPEGGSGTLEIKEITKGAAINYEAVPFEVVFNGADELVFIEVPSSSDEEIALFEFTMLDGIVVDDTEKNEDWWGIPGFTDGETTFFILNDYSSLMKKTSNQWTKKFAISSLKKGSNVWQKTNAIRTTVEQCINEWLNWLPSDLRIRAENSIDSDLQYSIAWSNQGNAYQHGNSRLGGNARLLFYKDATLSSIAHEVGHYMHHVLCGFEEYNNMVNRFPTDTWGRTIAHEAGDYREGRKEILEDIAGFSEYMITGSFFEHYDPENRHSNFTVYELFNKKSPDQADYPSHEGFGIWVFAGLTRSSDKIYTFNPNTPQVTVPVAGLSFTDITRIIALGPDNINELREFADQHLQSRGGNYRDMLPALLEPIGWSYNGLGKIVDEFGQPVQGAKVISVSKVGSKEYFTRNSTTSGSDGKFFLDRVFPGNNFLRVYYNGGSDVKDIPFNVSWEHNTSSTLDLGTINIKSGGNSTFRYLEMSFSGDHEFINNSGTNVLGDKPSPPSSLSINRQWSELQWSGNTFSLEIMNGVTSLKLTGMLSADQSTLLSLNYTYSYIDPSFNDPPLIIRKEYHISNVSLNRVESGNNVYLSSGKATESKITVTEWYYYEKATTDLTPKKEFEYVKTNFDSNTSLIIVLVK